MQPQLRAPTAALPAPATGTRFGSRWTTATSRPTTGGSDCRARNADPRSLTGIRRWARRCVHCGRRSSTRHGHCIICDSRALGRTCARRLGEAASASAAA
eukprot:1051594-Alexandrium_andersonii.AAC.1